MTAAAIAQLADLRSSTTALVLGLEDEKWSDTDMRAPSVLPGWTRGHVLTHIARNADGIAATVSGSLRGEIVKRYPGGQEGRNADIEAGSARTSLELIADVRDSADRLDRILAAAADAEAWDLPTDESRTIGQWLVRRWREVEVHRVDLGGSYAASDWPPSFVSYLVPALAQHLEKRTDNALRVEVTAEGSLTTDLPGSTWQVGSDEPTVVAGPDWAIAAWLTGRTQAVGDALSEMPELPPWL